MDGSLRTCSWSIMSSHPVYNASQSFEDWYSFCILTFLSTCINQTENCHTQFPNRYREPRITIPNRYKYLNNTFWISSSSCMTDFLAWWCPKCWPSKTSIASTLDFSWASCSNSSGRGKPNFAILSLYSFRHLSRTPLLKTSTREPVDGISPLFKASSI